MFDVCVCVLLYAQLICAAISICIAVRAKKTKNRVHPSQDDDDVAAARAQ